MTSFTYSIATDIQFGEGVSQQLAHHLLRLGFGRRLLLVTDEGLMATGIPQTIVKNLQASGFLPQLFTEVKANPRDEDCLRGAQAFQRYRADAVVAVGGGSAMDTAKAIALLGRQGGAPLDYADGRRSYGATAPIACVPTTAGTGSEVTRSAVITESKSHRKLTLKHERLRPALAVLDPLLTRSLPPAVTAATGVDALVHAIEGYTCTLTQPLSQAFGASAMPRIYRALPKAYHHPDDLAARSDMLLGSLLAGMCFGSSDVAAVHCLAEALGSLYDTPHGLANAVFLLPVLRYNATTCGWLYAEVARHMRVADAKQSDDDAVAALLDALAEWLRDLSIPTLSQLPEVRRADDERLVNLALLNGSTSSNPRTLSADDYRSILEEAYRM
ncbi:iron-containing alcohol dehydrogenase [Alicyclobacillus hesperidum URH17-3-68]|uniref:Alcohol dehydrogenase n=1 Tax=Alicyclobacillus hesperidum TaxID=89784 RepID=A0A1H2VCV0_9BACL|nr:iron-containing alcohol dehydrogenase [Alicyclobacillus hesperidum]EJY57234.1 iron-containing alcohol dehydrogenase [Alicyclobacillus hesperidum URH17-3-68]GLV14662.1 alcohol dehydrogenase [Alicyclobacillus hesperidum]SDW65764.1 alcohol dehydrogenase [Alicyclobacillus hesperidum]